MCEWARAVAQLAGEAAPQLTWPAERTRRVSSGTLDDTGHATTPCSTPVREASDAALRQALEGGPLTVAQLRAATGWPPTTLRGRLDSALDRGVIVRVRFGTFARE